MAQSSRTTQLEAAFREAGLGDVEAMADGVRVHVGDAELVVRPVAVGHGRPREVRDALARADRDEQPGSVVTLVAEHFTTGALEMLSEVGANFVDDRRFVLRNQAPFVAIDRVRQVVAAAEPAREPALGGKIGMVVQEMLLRDTEWWQVTELARAAGVAPGTAQAGLQRLEQLDLVDVQGSGPNKRRRLRDRGAVLDTWTPFAQRERRRLTTTYLLSQTATDLAEQVSCRLSEARIGHAVTGACAALLVAPHVTDVRTCEVWVGPGVSESLVMAALGAAPVAMGGNVVVLQAKTEAPLFAVRPAGSAAVANPLRLYADLLEDPRRGEEQAQFLRETLLGF